MSLPTAPSKSKSRLSNHPRSNHGLKKKASHLAWWLVRIAVSRAPRRSSLPLTRPGHEGAGEAKGTTGLEVQPQPKLRHFGVSGRSDLAEGAGRTVLSVCLASVNAVAIDADTWLERGVCRSLTVFPDRWA
jgi:hypothetical protein